MAAVAQGAPLTTSDLDLCYRRPADNYSKLADAMRPLLPKLRGANADIPFLWDQKTLENGCNFTLETDGRAVDLLGQLTGVGGYEDLFPGAATIQLFGHDVRVMGLADLIRAKKAAGRTKDLLALPILRATQRILNDRP